MAHAKVGDEIQISLGPFSSVYNTPDPGTKQPTRLFDSVNMLVPDAANGSAVVARHGCLGLPTQLGNSAGRTGQKGFIHRRTDGTIDRFKFAGGRMYSWDGTDSMTCDTDITPGGIFISPTNPIFCLTYFDTVIVSDETYKPWVYDPAAKSGTVIEIDSLATDWCSKGGATNYDGKPFFIVKRTGESVIDSEGDSDISAEDGSVITSELQDGGQSTMVWGEENTPLVGYQQANFDNAWTLTQSSDEVLSALSGEEGELIYIRNKGIGRITGAVTTDFKSAATRDQISGTVGSNAPAATISINGRIWFLDLDGLPYRVLAAGGQPEPLYFPLRGVSDTEIGTAGNRTNVVTYGRAAYHEGYKLVLFTIWDRRTVYAFDVFTGGFVSSWVLNGAPGSSIHIDAMDAMIDANNRTTFMFMGTRGSVYDTAHQGVVWREKHPDDVNQWLDQADASVASYTALTRAVETQWITSNAAAAYRVRDVATQLLGDTARHAVNLQYTTPSAGLSNAVAAQSTATVGEKSAADSIASARWSTGPNAQGTAVRLRWSATHADNVRFGVHGAVATAVVTKARPKAA